MWLFANGETPQAPLDTAFEWSNGQLHSYQLDSSNPALQAGSDTPIVVDATGTAWIGLNRTVVSVDPISGSIDTFTLPDVSVADSGSGLPVPPPGTPAELFTDIDAMALGANGDVIIGRMYATELQVLDLSTGGISAIPLPDPTELSGTGAGDLTGNGSEVAAALYAGQGEHELGQYVDESWVVSDSDCDASAVSMGSGLLAVTGDGCVAVGALAEGQPATVSSQPVSSNVPITASSDGPCAMAVSPTEVAYCSQDALGIGPVGESSDVSVALGQIAEGPPSIPGGATSGGVIGNTLTPITPGLLAASGSGALWFVPAEGGTDVGVVEHG